MSDGFRLNGRVFLGHRFLRAYGFLSSNRAEVCVIHSPDGHCNLHKAVSRFVILAPLSPEFHASGACVKFGGEGLGERGARIGSGRRNPC